MTYTGDVQVGGPTQVRVLDELEIRKVAVGPMQNNAYLLTCRAVGAQLLIDAADDPDRLLALLQEGHDAARPGRDHPPAPRPPPRPGVDRRRDRGDRRGRCRRRRRHRRGDGHPRDAAPPRRRRRRGSGTSP